MLAFTLGLPFLFAGIRGMAPEAPFARYGLVLAVQETLSDARSDPLAKATALHAASSGGFHDCRKQRCPSAPKCPPRCRRTRFSFVLSGKLQASPWPLDVCELNEKAHQ